MYCLIACIVANDSRPWPWENLGQQLSDHGRDVTIADQDFPMAEEIPTAAGHKV